MKRYTRDEAIEAVRGIVAGLVDLNHETLEVLSNEVWSAGMALHIERRRVELAEQITDTLAARAK